MTRQCRRFGFRMILAALCGIVLPPTPLPGQWRAAPGLDIGREIGPSLVELPTSGRSSSSGTLLGAHVIFPNIIGKGQSLWLRCGLRATATTFVSDSVQFLVMPLSSSPIVAPGRLLAESDEGHVRLDAGISWRFAHRLGLGMGVWGSMRFASTSTVTRRLFPISGLSETLLDSSTRLDAPIDGLGFRFGAVLSCDYNVPLSELMTISPGLFVRLDARALDRGAGLGSVGFGGILSVTFGANAPERREEVSARPGLSVSVQLGGDESASKAIRARVQRCRHQQAMPVLPVIFFDSGAAGIPARYAWLTSRGRDSLPTLLAGPRSPVDLYRCMINVIGARMNAEPTSRITLRGGISADEPRSLAIARAESVRSYLGEVWGIDESRIEVAERSNDDSIGADSALARSVTVDSRFPRILAPIVTEWVEREMIVPPIRMGRKIDAEAGLKGWSVTLTKEGAELARASGGKDDEPGVMSIEFDLDETGGAAGTLVARLSVVDSVGTIATAVDRAPVLIAAESDTTAERGGRTSHYVLLDPSLSKIVAGGNDPLIEAMAASVGDGAIVMIFGSDVPVGMGEPGRPAWDAQSVAGTILTMWNARGRSMSSFSLQGRTSSVPAGEVTPEERMLAASVIVTVTLAAEDDGAMSSPKPER